MKAGTIMIVDDEAQCREHLRNSLESLGWGAITASSGKDALKQMEACRPDAIVLDMTMSEMDGFELARKLKNNPAYKSIPILAATGLCGWGDREKCLAAGCDDYVVKPFTAEELQRHLRKLIRLS